MLFVEYLQKYILPYCNFTTWALLHYSYSFFPRVFITNAICWTVQALLHLFAVHFISVPSPTFYWTFLINISSILITLSVYSLALTTSGEYSLCEMKTIAYTYLKLIKHASQSQYVTLRKKEFYFDKNLFIFRFLYAFGK